MRTLGPVVSTIRKPDKGLAYQLRQAALHIAADWGYASSEVLHGLEAELDIVCGITWVLAHRR